jgi:long-chain acyl-CoA synthetase
VPRLYEKIYITFQQQLGSSPAKKKLFDWAMKVGMKALQYRDDGMGRYNMHPDFDLKSKLPPLLKLKFTVADKLFAKVRALFGNRFRYSFSASAGISEDLLRFFYAMGFPVIEGYGSTESFNACILNPITACKPGFVGKDANGSKSRVADDGELEISGAGIFKGYLNRPEENEEVFTEDGWFKTGDLVVKDDGGYVKIVDRKKAIICTATGKNVAPAKLENLFSTSPVIEQVFFIGDERNFITALLVPNFNYFTDLYDKKDISYNKTLCKWSSATGAEICYSVGNDFVDTDVLKEMIEDEVQKANKWLERFEQIKKYAVLTERFTEENGMLTPTQKAKKRVILEAYADRIDALYAEE